MSFKYFNIEEKQNQDVYVPPDVGLLPYNVIDPNIIYNYVANW